VGQNSKNFLRPITKRKVRVQQWSSLLHRHAVDSMKIRSCTNFMQQRVFVVPQYRATRCQRVECGRFPSWNVQKINTIVHRSLRASTRTASSFDQIGPIENLLMPPHSVIHKTIPYIAPVAHLVRRMVIATGAAVMRLKCPCPHKTNG